MSWSRVPWGDVEHVLPEDDSREHEASESCWCAPTRDTSQVPNAIIHNAEDGRPPFSTPSET